MADISKVLDLLGPSRLDTALPGVAVVPDAVPDVGDWKTAWAAENAPKAVDNTPSSIPVDPLGEKIAAWAEKLNK